MDIVCNCLERVKIVYLVDAVTGLLQKSLVYDDAEALVAVADGVGEAVLIGEVEGVSGHLIPNVGVGEVVAVLAPSINGALVANLEHGGSLALVHLGGEGLLIGAGGGGDYLHGNAGLLGVGGGKPSAMPHLPRA